MSNKEAIPAKLLKQEKLIKSMTKKEVRKVVNQRIFIGKTKQEIFDELKDISKLSTKDLAKIIQKTPSLKAKKKYKTSYIVLKIMLVLTIIFKLKMGIQIIIEDEIKNVFQIILILSIIPIINTLLLIGVSKYRPNSFKLAAIFTFLGLYQYMRSGIVFEEVGAIIFLDLFIHLGIIVLALHLDYKFFPKYLTNKELYHNTQGEEKVRQVIKFVE